MNNSAFFRALMHTDELAPDTMKVIMVENLEILVARVGQEFFVAENRCPHMGARLSEGRLEGTVLVCPRHHSRFDLRDGRVLQWTDLSGPVGGIAKVLKRPRKLRVFPVKVEQDMLLAKL